MYLQHTLTLVSYPHYPDLTPTQKPIRVPVLVRPVTVLYNDTDGTDPLFDDDSLNNFLDTSVPYPDCEDDTLSLDSTSNSLTIDTFFQDSDYASDYIVQTHAWAANSYQFPSLAGQTLRILPLGGKHLDFPAQSVRWQRLGASTCLLTLSLPKKILT